MTEITVVIRVFEIIGVYITSLPASGTMICLIHIFQAKTFTLIRREQSQCRAQFEIIVSVSYSALETQTELSTSIAINLITCNIVDSVNHSRLFCISVRTVDHLQILAQIIISRSHCCIIFLAVFLIPCIADIGCRDTTRNRRQINREISSVITLLPVNTDRYICIRRS